MLDNRESPMALGYWSQVGGALVPEYPLVRRSENASVRRADALILPTWEKGVLAAKQVARAALAGQDIIVVQAKAERLGMYLMGQAVFSKLLIERRNPASVRSVALVEKDDAELRPLLDQFPGVEVVVLSPPHDLDPDVRVHIAALKAASQQPKVE